MPFANLPLRTVNADGSSSVFGAAGNARTTIHPDGETLIFAEPEVVTGGVDLPLWYTPSPTVTLLQSIMNGDTAFQSMMDGLSVFTMYEAMLTLPDSVLVPFFAYLSNHGIKLAIEGMPLIAQAGQPGDGVESFSRPGDLLSLLTRLQTLGGTLDYLAWDEPWFYGHKLTGLLSLSEVAAQVAASSAIVKSLFPNARIGDIEPVGGSPTDAADMTAWFAAYEAASGKPFDFFNADVTGWVPGWQSSLAAVIEMVHGRGMQMGTLLTGMGSAAGDVAWTKQAVSMGQQILSDPRLRPDMVIVQSWQNHPAEAPLPHTPGTFASVAQDTITGMGSALAVPAVAAYDASGLLRTVTWSGGWAAEHLGNELLLTSPQGVVTSRFAWNDVRVFAFDPDGGRLALTVRDASALGATEQLLAYTVTIAAGQFNLAPTPLTPPHNPGTLSLALSPTSETGFAGSGITRQTAPKLAGTGSPGAQIRIAIDGTDAGATVVAADGSWTFTVATPLAHGAHLIEATSEPVPGAGVRKDQYVVSIDPDQRIQPTLSLARGSDTGMPGDQITYLTQPSLSGIGDPATRIHVTVDNQLVGSVLTDASGAWSYTLSSPLTPGAHDVRVRASGPPGTSPASVSIQLLINTLAAEEAVVTPNELFNPTWYLRQYADAAASALDPYTHFMTLGWKSGYDPSPFFSTSHYLGRYSDIAATGVNPLLHFEEYGWKEGRDPSSAFNTIQYYLAHPELPVGTNPLLAYIDSLQTSIALAPGSDSGYPGDRITTRTKPVFTGVDDPNARINVTIDGNLAGSVTADANGNWSYAVLSPLALGSHVITASASGPPETSRAPATFRFEVNTRADETAATNSDPLFAAAWYLRRYPVAATSYADAYTHYMTKGWKAGYDPSPFFSSRYYLDRYTDVATAGVNPLRHFEDHGWKEGRDPSSTFNTIDYYATHPGLPPNVNPVIAYIQGLAAANAGTVAAGLASVATGSLDLAPIAFMTDTSGLAPNMGSTADVAAITSLKEAAAFTTDLVAPLSGLALSSQVATPAAPPAILTYSPGFDPSTIVLTGGAHNL